MSAISLKTYNTFGIDVKAAKFVAIRSQNQLQELLANSSLDTEYFVLGGGSNMLLTQDITQTVLHIAVKGYELIQKTTNYVILKVAGGENWHDFVMYCIANDYGGVENLSLIPGNVGTAPVQNIGAYGVELKEVFYSCKAVSRATGEVRVFGLNDCHFGYRDSVFKGALKNQYIITSVTFKLSVGAHKVNTDYGAIADTLKAKGIAAPSIKQVSDAVIAIRQSKLPDPDVIGNSGSFFKNPTVNQATFSALRKKFPELPFYPVAEDVIKIPAGWLIEKAGFKGKRFGDAGVHDKQALVLVNHGNASGQEIWALAMQIQKEVQALFGLEITPEVQVF